MAEFRGFALRLLRRRYVFVTTYGVKVRIYEKNTVYHILGIAIAKPGP